MFEPNPSDECDTKSKVEEALVGYCEDDECRRKCEEYCDKSMQIMFIRLQAV